MHHESDLALVTGANRGLGLETARQLARRNMRVIIGSRDAADCRKAAQALSAECLAVWPVELDIVRPETYKRAVMLIEEMGGVLDVLVNNAGVRLEESRFDHTSSVTSAVLRDSFETNFFGTVALTQVLLPFLRKSRSARIVNVSSILGSGTLQGDSESPIYEAKAFAYSATKAALNMFTIHLAHELRSAGIKVNSAHPGWVKTDMGGANADMSVEEGSLTIVELATLPENGPTGIFVHRGRMIPW